MVRWGFGGTAPWLAALCLVGSLSACGAGAAGSAQPDASAAAVDGAGADGAGADGGAVDGTAQKSGPFATAVVSFKPGAGAGFGQENLPGVVLGPPEGKGAGAGSLDVVSLGCGGSIVLSLAPNALVDGPGVDLLVFENAFTNWAELGRVAVSEDGETWHTWPCDPADKAGGYPGCAGVAPVLANSDNGIDPTDPAVAGGDAFDLADLGVKRARFVRITDTGTNPCAPPSAGFDLDAVALVHRVNGALKP